MDAEQALRELTELSSQITAALVLDADGATLATSSADAAVSERLASTTRELIGAAGELGGEAREVTRVEVELDEGALFVVRDGAYTVAATTGPSPTSGLVVYDLRTCAQAIDAPAGEPKKRRSRKKAESEEGEA
jgi:predicted regulator of Ras-like GTPase activity (Roadblock/LC7/MglB family)